MGVGASEIFDLGRRRAFEWREIGIDAFIFCGAKRRNVDILFFIRQYPVLNYLRFVKIRNKFV